MSRTLREKTFRLMEHFVMLATIAGAIWMAFWFPLLSASSSDAVKSKTDSYNIVLLIDKSGSMNSTDENRHAINAARMFVDSLYTGVQNK